MKKNYLIHTLFAFFIFQSNAYACVGSGVNSCSMQSSHAYKSGHGSATVHAYPANSQSTLSLQKTLIIVPGYDPTNEQSPNNILASVNDFGLLNQLSSQGYDIVVFKPKDSNTYIQRNAFTLVDLLQDLSKSPTNEITVLGLSLGGVTAKYALLYMRSQGLAHNVRSYISFDSPHDGAHIPLAIQAIPAFLVESTSSFESHLNKASAFGVRVKNIAKVFKKFNTTTIQERLKDGEAAAAMVSTQFIQSPIAKQLLKQHHFLAEYDKAEAAIKSALVIANRTIPLGRGDSIAPPKPCEKRVKIPLGRGSFGYNENRLICVELEQKRIPWGNHYCESEYIYIKHGLVRHSGKGGTYHYQPISQCAAARNAYALRDHSQAKLDELAVLKSELSKEIAAMGGHPSYLHSVAITNGNLAGQKLDIKPGQPYFSYTSQSYEGAVINMHAHAEAPEATYFDAHLRAPNADSYKHGLLSSGDKYRHFGTTLLKNPDNRDFLDNASGGHSNLPQTFSNLFNGIVGAEFGNITPLTSHHSFISTCSALAIPRSVDDCQFNSTAEAAQASPFNKVYSVQNTESESSPHLSLNSSTSNAILNEINSQ